MLLQTHILGYFSPIHSVRWSRETCLLKCTVPKKVDNIQESKSYCCDSLLVIRSQSGSTICNCRQITILSKDIYSSSSSFNVEFYLEMRSLCSKNNLSQLMLIANNDNVLPVRYHLKVIIVIIIWEKSSSCSLENCIYQFCKSNLHLFTGLLGINMHQTPEYRAVSPS